MISAQHTPYMLTIVSSWNDYMIEGANGEEIIFQDGAYGTPTIKLAHADRLVKCWNALADLPQDALDGGWTRAGLEAYGNSMKAQRDELLAMLKAIVLQDDQQCLSRQTIEQARDLIEKVEQQ